MKQMYLARVTDIIDESVISVPGELTIKELNTILKSSGQAELPVAVLRSDGSFGGVIGDMKFDPSRAFLQVSELSVKAPLLVEPEANAFELVAQMLAKGMDFAAVVSGGIFRGLVTRRSVTRAFGEMSAA